MKPFALSTVALLGALATSIALGAAVYGRIGEKYAQLGRERSPLGRALTDEAPAEFGGRFNRFQHGFIYWHPETDAHGVWGLIGEKWNALGRERFGYPITDELPTADGRGRYNHFRAIQAPGRLTPGLRPALVKPESSIYWSPQTGAHAVYGAIRDKWFAMGAERSPLGYPTSDEGPGAFSGRVQAFQGGYIAWHLETGAHDVRGEIAKKWSQVGREQFGYPVAGEMPTAKNAGRYSVFRAAQRPDKAEASIYWHPDHGTHTVYGEIRRKWASMEWERGRAGYPTSDEFDDRGYRRQNFSGGGAQATMYMRWSKRAGAEFIAADRTPAQCTQVFREFRQKQRGEDLYLEACSTIMGLVQYCEQRDSFVGVQYVDNQSRRLLTCFRRARPDTVWEQADRIAAGVSQGVGDAFVAAAPFMGAALNGAACINGVIYSCGLLALDLADKGGVDLGKLGSAASTALDYANLASQCMDGDISSCARLGAKGARRVGLAVPGVNTERLVNDILDCSTKDLDVADCARRAAAYSKAVGITIPGVDAQRVADDVAACSREDYAACARLGQAAAAAAGVPTNLGADSLADARSCIEGDAVACAELGAKSAKSGVSLGGIPNGAALSSRCLSGDGEACRQLGLAAASSIGAPTLRTWYVRRTVRLKPVGVARTPQAESRIDLAGVDLPADLVTLPDNSSLNIAGRTVTAGEVKRMLRASDDNTIIIVGGRQLRAGYIKRALDGAVTTSRP